MDVKTRSRNTFLAWAALNFPQNFCAAWQEPQNPDGTLWDWGQWEEGRRCRVLWRGGPAGGYKYFYLTLPYFSGPAAARAACPAYEFGAGNDRVPLGSGCRLDLTTGYRELNLYYPYSTAADGLPKWGREGLSWLGWTQRWQAGDRVQLWTDGATIRCCITSARGNGEGTAQGVVLCLVENAYIPISSGEQTEEKEEQP